MGLNILISSFFKHWCTLQSFFFFFQYWNQLNHYCFSCYCLSIAWKKGFATSSTYILWTDVKIQTFRDHLMWVVQHWFEDIIQQKGNYYIVGWPFKHARQTGVHIRGWSLCGLNSTSWEYSPLAGFWCSYTVCSLIKLNTAVTSRLLAVTAVIYVSWFYCFYEGILDSYRENRVALGGGSCISSWELGSDSCVQHYQWIQSTL
jgi:hypothetical protein